MCGTALRTEESLQGRRYVLITIVLRHTQRAALRSHCFGSSMNFNLDMEAEFEIKEAHYEFHYETVASKVIRNANYLNDLKIMCLYAFRFFTTLIPCVNLQLFEWKSIS